MILHLLLYVLCGATAVVSWAIIRPRPAAPADWSEDWPDWLQNVMCHIPERASK
jgi:hypothetical protein